jgi:hypothetical protein
MFGHSICVSYMTVVCDLPGQPMQVTLIICESLIFENVLNSTGHNCSLYVVGLRSLVEILV